MSGHLAASGLLLLKMKLLIAFTLIRRQLELNGHWTGFCFGPAADKLIVRDNVEFAVRGSNLDLWPFGCFCLNRTAFGAGLAKTAIGFC